MVINVTKPFLPEIADYSELLSRIWSTGWLTNNGPMVLELEERLRSFLGVKNLSFVSNGTIALQIAIRSLRLSGEIITTPFSYVATTSTIVWEHCRPVMVDIDPQTFNIDPRNIEGAITPKTSAILATHVYGNPCDVVEIERIAAKHGIKVIYDAAHAFGVRYLEDSIFNFGDVSCVSFHATKLFHTIEGGAVIARDAEVDHLVSRMRNFGHASPTSFDEIGINGKNSEFHAAMGLINLPQVSEIIAKRHKISERYREHLKQILRHQEIDSECEYNYAYYPVIFESEEDLLRGMARLKERDVHPRRYFYPSLSNLPYLDSAFDTPVCADLAPRALCLPLYPSLDLADVDMICEILQSALDK